MTNLDTLISRVRELKGPDREADALVHHLTASGETFLTLDLDCQLQVFERGGQVLTAPAYTASLEATVNLIERELPHGYDLWVREGSSVAMVYWSENDGVRTTAKTAPLALLLAALTAIKERDA